MHIYNGPPNNMFEKMFLLIEVTLYGMQCKTRASRENSGVGVHMLCRTGMRVGLS